MVVFVFLTSRHLPFSCFARMCCLLRLASIPLYMSHCMGKPAICIGENKGADQLCSNCEADQRLCFRYTDSTIRRLSKSKISSLYPSYMTIQAGLCRTWSEPKLLVFSRTDSYICEFHSQHNLTLEDRLMNVWQFPC